MCLMAELDPCGTENRCRRRFVRRAYQSMGPNETWHVDGYDKLKPFGIAVSGWFDGFSRKIMWLNFWKTNNDPSIIVQNYINCVVEHGVFPKRLRTDCGTENGLMAALHCSLRSEHTDEFAGAKSHMYGTSTSNQRIESWWSYFRKQRFLLLLIHLCFTWPWINVFAVWIHNVSEILCVLLCFLKERKYLNIKGIYEISKRHESVVNGLVH